METIKIDDAVVNVADLPEQLQQIINLYEEATTQEVAARRNLALKEAARLELTRRIVLGYRDHVQLTSQQPTEPETQAND